MNPQMGRKRIFRLIAMACGLYLLTVGTFFAWLQNEASVNDAKASANASFYSNHKILNFDDNAFQIDPNDVFKSARNGLELHDSISNSEMDSTERARMPKNEAKTLRFPENDDEFGQQCFLPADFSRDDFTALEETIYLYSAYLDERFDERTIRIMSVLALQTKNKTLKIFCHFNVTGVQVTTDATLYELCENQQKIYGGFMWSCKVPSLSLNVCYVNVSLILIPTDKRHAYDVQNENTVTLAITKLDTKHVKFNYSICVPPLFGNITAHNLIEFIELNRLFGVEHFFFYNYNITNSKLLKLLDIYSRYGLVTLVKWNLPSIILKDQIWYNGQVSAHNDCLYRAMSWTNYLAITDVDEYIVPHNHKRTFHESFGDMFTSAVCGLSFDSVVYDLRYPKSSRRPDLGLVTMDNTAHGIFISKIRTKVMVKPINIFEVGIHHVSKTVTKDFSVLKVNISTAYIHHYRNCELSFGMTCGGYVVDETLLSYKDELQAAVTKMKSIFFNK